MLKHPNTTLAVLAGGKARRMQGANKALLKHNGVTFVEQIIESLSAQFGETIIISNDNEISKIMPCPIYKDIIRDKGPLGGIHSALTNALNPAVFIVSCDMPFVNTKVLDRINEQASIIDFEAVVPIYKDRTEPLFAFYSVSTINRLMHILNGNRLSVKAFLEKINTKHVKLPATDEYGRYLTNINTIKDYNQFL